MSQSRDKPLLALNGIETSVCAEFTKNSIDTVGVHLNRTIMPVSKCLQTEWFHVVEYIVIMSVQSRQFNNNLWMIGGLRAVGTATVDVLWMAHLKISWV